MGIWMFKQSRFYLKQFFPCQFIEQMGSPGDSVELPGGIEELIILDVLI